MFKWAGLNTLGRYLQLMSNREIRKLIHAGLDTQITLELEKT